MLFDLIMLFSLISIATAQDGYEKEGKEFAKKQLKEVSKLDLESALENKEKLKKPEEGQKNDKIIEDDCGNCKADLVNPLKNLKDELGNNAPEILIFVSFSMPNIAIRELNENAQKHNAKLILRGLHEKSFKKTSKKILEIDKNGVQIDIDPELFKRYKIEKVPVFVLVKNDKEVSRLSGNVSLDYAKSKLVKK